MAAVVAIGEAVRVQGLALAGARVLPAEDAEQVRAAWGRVGDDVAVVVLTARAAEAMTPPSAGPLVVVMPP